MTPRITRVCPSTTHVGKRVEFCSEACKEKWPYDHDCYDCKKPDSSKAHKALDYRHLVGLRCPGCCGPVQIKELGHCDADQSEVNRVRTVALTCAGAQEPGSLSCGPHGTITYVKRLHEETCEIAPSAATQDALDRAFSDRAARELETAKRLAAGDHDADLGKLCVHHVHAQHFGITGPRQATTHGKDCVCITGKPYSEDPKKRYTVIPELDPAQYYWPPCPDCGGLVLTGTYGADKPKIDGHFHCYCRDCKKALVLHWSARHLRSMQAPA